MYKRDIGGIGCNMKQHFWKVHSNGNDFIFVKNHIFTSEEIVKLCDRHRGIGADGILCCLENPLTMRIFNADGSEAAMCGNGLRCFMMMVRYLGLSEKTTSIKTMKDEIVVSETDSHPFMCGYQLNVVENKPLLEVSGTRHLVLFEEMDESKAAQIEKELDCNIDFVRILDGDTIQVRTWERGVGKTDACGTGACASVYAAWKKQLVTGRVTVKFKIESAVCEASECSVWTEGNAVLVYEGEIELGNRETASFDSAITKKDTAFSSC